MDLLFLVVFPCVFALIVFFVLQYKNKTILKGKDIHSRIKRYSRGETYVNDHNHREIEMDILMKPIQDQEFISEMQLFLKNSYKILN